jgi:D-inositol-3-phosphate glycosyltransferase
MNVYVRETVRVMASRGVLVDIFTRRHGDADEDVALGTGCRLVHISAGPPGTAKRDLPPWLESFVQGVEEFARREGGAYGGVVSHYWLSGLAGIRLRDLWGGRHVAGLHTLAVPKSRAFPYETLIPARIAGERLVVKEADALLAATIHDHEALVVDYGADGDRIVVAPPAVDTARFRPRDRQDCCRELGLSAEGRRLLLVGRTIPLKGIEVLFEALSLMARDVSALIVGGELNGREHESLAATARRLGVVERVTFVGSVPHEDLPLYYGASDVCVLPSYYESFGLAALEALACGRPVVASKVGGLASVVDHGVNGFLVTSGSPDEFVKATATLLGDQDLWHSLGLAGVESARHRGWEQTAETILGCLADPGMAAHPPIEASVAIPRS